MTDRLLAGLLAANVAAALAVTAVLGLRSGARKVFGARCAYGLWLVVPAAMLAGLLRARTVALAYSARAPGLAAAPAGTFGAAAPVHASPALFPAIDLSQALVGLWLAGVATSLVLLAVNQRRAVARFGRLTADAGDPAIARAENGRIGPALIGIFRPRLILPADFEARFEVEERAIILAHERTHAQSGHAAINALVALATAVNWFNPLVHIGAAFALIDQELACDAAVVGRFPAGRRSYAAALIKTQLEAGAFPLGCSWPARSTNLLMERLEMLEQAKPGGLRLFAGGAVVAILSLSAGVAAWAAEPPVVVAEPAAVAAQGATDATLPADPLANLGKDVRAIFGSGQDASLLVTETDHGAQASRTLKIGDEYLAGWTIKTIAGRTATLSKGDQIRTVVLTGLPEAVAKGPPPAPAKASVSDASAEGPSLSDQRAAERAGRDVEYAAIIARGGTAEDLARAMAADGLIFVAMVNPQYDKARFIRMPSGRIGLLVPGPSGGGMVEIMDVIQTYNPPGGIASLPTAEEAVGDR